MTSRTITADDPGLGGLQCLIQAGPASFVADEPVDIGGFDMGPNPHDLVAAGLAACTAHTLRLYAKRKSWPLGALHVEVTHSREASATPPDRFTRTIRLGGDLDEEQRARLLDIAEKCPVHKLLTGGAAISTTLSD
jgi:putative redox protein